MAKNEALSKLQSMMNHNQTPRMDTVRGGNDFLNAFSQGYNAMGTVMDGIRARNDRNRLQKLMNQVLGGNQQQPQSDLPVITDEKGNSFSILGDGSAVPVNTQQQDPDYSMKSFMKNAIGSGMLPSNAMAAYSSFIAPLEEDLRDRNKREAMAVLARRNQGQGLSDEEYYNTMAKLNFNLGEDYALKDNNAIIDQMAKVQSGLLTPIGAMHDPENYRRIGYPINLNMWDKLAPTVGINPTNYSNYSMGFNNGSAGSEYGGDNENARAIYTYLKNKGYADNVIASIMGNLQAESQFNPAIGYGDGGTSGGIAQWHDEEPGVGRLSNLKNYAVNRQMDWKDLNTQLDFMIDEINKNYPNLIQELSKMNPNEGAIYFHEFYERSRDNAEQKARRGTYADEIYNRRRAGGRDWSQSLEGKSWVRNNNNVNLSKAQNQTLQGLNQISDAFQRMTGKQLIVTSGNDSNVHASGQFSHGNAWKVDVSGNGLENPETRNAFIKQCESLGIKVRDEYSDPSAGSTGEHLDLDFSGYRGGNSVGYSYQPQQPSYFGSVFKPQVVSGQGAILNPMVLLEALTKQAERQRLQNNADRQFYVNQQQLIETKRHNLAMEAGRYGNNTGVTTNLLDKNGKFIAPYEVNTTIEKYLSDFEANLKKQQDDGVLPEKLLPNAQIMQNIVGTLNPIYKKFIDNGITESQARSVLNEYLRTKYKDLDKESKGIIKITHINDITNRLSIKDNNKGEATFDENLKVINEPNPKVDAEQKKKEKRILTAKNMAYNQAFEKARRGEVEGIGYFQRNVILPEGYNSSGEAAVAKENLRKAKEYAEKERDKIKTYEDAVAYLKENNATINTMLEEDDGKSLYDKLGEQFSGVREKIKNNDRLY